MADTNRASVVTNDLGEFDRLTLVRLGVWGLSAFLSMMLVVIAAQTDVGVKRAAAAVAAITSPPRDPTVTLSQVLARTAESEREARRLVETVRQLTMERDRMAMRMDSVEREVGDLTGSINKSVSNAIQAQSAALDAKGSAAPQPKTPQQPPPAVAPTASVPAVAPAVPPSAPPPPAIRAPPPAVSSSSVQPPAVATTAMIPSVPPPTIDPRTARPAWPSFMPPPTSPSIEMSATAPSDNAAAAAPETIPLPRPSPIAQLQAYATANARGENPTLPPGQIPQPAQTQQAAPRPADVTGSVQTAQSAPAGAPPQAAPAENADSAEQPKVEIGVDLGPALSISRLRTRWEAFRQAQGASLPNVRPVVSFRETGPNKPVELRLVVGPFSGIDVAVQFCQSLSGSQFPCQPAVFDGQRLATR